MLNNLQINGDSQQGFSAHYDETKTKEDAKLKGCPFCGSENVEIGNTHTPAYFVQCVDCNAETHATYTYGKALKTRKQCQREHQRSFMSAVDAWNTRA